jgi:hypothetical protein
MDDDTKKKAKEAGAAMCDGLMERVAEKPKGPWPPETAPSYDKQVKVLDSILALQAKLSEMIRTLDYLRAMLLVGWRHAGNVHDYRMAYHDIIRCHSMDRWKIPAKLKRLEQTLRRKAEKLASG